MEAKEFEWKIRSIIERSDEVLEDPDTPEYIKEIMDDIREIAQSIQHELEKGKINISG
jgi:transcription initiation factor IIE alpha subunit